MGFLHIVYLIGYSCWLHHISIQIGCCLWGLTGDQVSHSEFSPWFKMAHVTFLCNCAVSFTYSYMSHDMWSIFPPGLLVIINQVTWEALEISNTTFIIMFTLIVFQRKDFLIAVNAFKKKKSELRNIGQKTLSFRHATHDPWVGYRPYPYPHPPSSTLGGEMRRLQCCPAFHVVPLVHWDYWFWRCMSYCM